MFFMISYGLLVAKTKEFSRHVSAKRVSSTRVIGEELDVFGSLRCSETLWPFSALLAAGIARSALEVTFGSCCFSGVL